MDEIRSLEDVKQLAEERRIEKLPSLQAPAPSVMNLAVTVDDACALKPQELQVVRPFYETVNLLPETLPAEAKIVGQALFDVFDRARAVKEGLVKDLTWGFLQCGIPAKLTVIGLYYLERAGYIKLQGTDNTWVNFDGRIDECWVRYQKKLLDLVYSG